MLPRNLKEKFIYAASMMLSGLINKGRDPKALQVQNILCVKLDEIGDLVYSLHVFKLLKERYPQAKLTLVCKPYCNSLVKNDPDIDEVLNEMPHDNRAFDLIIDMRGNWQSIRYALFNRPQYRLDRGAVRYRNKKKGAHPHEVITNFEIVAPLLDEKAGLVSPEIAVSAAAKQKAASFLVENQIGSYAVLHPGARRVLRQWPAANYVALATYLQQKKGMDIVFTGDAGESAEIDAMRAQLPFVTHSIAGQFDLEAFAALLKTASLYVGNESGPLAMASVSGIPALGLFGPGEPYVFYPWGERTGYLHYVLECNPCDQVHCVHPDNPCITRISVAEAIAKAEALLKK